MGFDLTQIKDLITRTIKEQGLYSESAVNLLLGTAAQESDLGTYLYQKPSRTAKGIFQMETGYKENGIPRTEISLWENYLKYRYKRRVKLTKICGVFSPHNEGAMEWNLKYQILMCRLYYWIVPDPLPNPYDIIGLAKYWNIFWNRNPEAGTEAEFIRKYRMYVDDS